jgi:hypothetical protein
MPVPGHPLGVCLVLAPGPARAEKRGETPGQVVGEPLADAPPELLVLGAGPHPRLPNNGPAGPQGGLQARGSFVSGQLVANGSGRPLADVPGQRLTAARRLSLPSTCFVGGHLVELTIPAAISAAAGRFGDGPALAEPGGRASVITS